jgi:hypothetical protein
MTGVAGFEDLKISAFSDLTPCSPLKKAIPITGLEGL